MPRNSDRIKSSKPNADNIAAEAVLKDGVLVQTATRQFGVHKKQGSYKMEKFDISLQYISQDGLNLMSVCDGLRAARLRFKSRVEFLRFSDACLQALIQSSQEEFMAALEGADTLPFLCTKINENLQYTRSLMVRIEAARDFLLGKVDHPEFLPPVQEELKRLTTKFLIAEIDLSFIIPFVIYRYNSDVRT